MPPLGQILDRLVDEEIHERVSEMAMAKTDFGYDSWGTSVRATRRMMVLTRWLYRNYFRVSTTGLSHIPQDRVLLIGNHSSQFAYDALLIGTALALEPESPRQVRSMIEKSSATAPFVNVLMSRVGQQIGLPSHAERLLTREEAPVLVFPEGERGGGKLFKDRYKIMGFGTGFMRIAMKTQTPIVPFAFIGGEEMCPSVSRLPNLAKLVGMAYLPLTPLGPIPLPTKCSLRFGLPMYFEGSGDESDNVVRAQVDEVQEAVEELIAQGLSEREGVFR